MFIESSFQSQLSLLHLLSVEVGDVTMVLILYIYIYNSNVVGESLSLSPSLHACASFSVLWKVLVSVGPRLTPTKTELLEMALRRSLRNYHPHSTPSLQRPPPRFREGAVGGTGRVLCGWMNLLYRLITLTYSCRNIQYSLHVMTRQQIVFTINKSIFLFNKLNIWSIKKAHETINTQSTSLSYNLVALAQKW